MFLVLCYYCFYIMPEKCLNVLDLFAELFRLSRSLLTLQCVVVFCSLLVGYLNNFNIMPEICRTVTLYPLLI